MSNQPVTIETAVEAVADHHVIEVLTLVFSRPDSLSRAESLAASLQLLSLSWAVVFFVAGLTCMLSGYRFYKVITVLLGLLIGLTVGYCLGKPIHAAPVVAGCLGILIGVGCWPLMKHAVAVLASLSGAFVGANLWVGVARLAETGDNAATLASNYWIGALIGLMLFGMLSFLLFKFSVVLFTSVAGALIAVLGAMALLLQVPQWRAPVTESLAAHPIIVPMLIIVPAVIGLILQQSQDPGDPADTAAKPA